MAEFTLELLHAADQEAGIPAIEDAPRFSAVLNALRAQDADGDGNASDNTLVLSSGDAYIPGLFFNASTNVYGAPGRADILIQNELGFQAIAFGNHEFDAGTARVADLVGGGADDPATPENESFIGAQFPYLSGNLDFSTDLNLAGLVVPDAQAPQANSIAGSTVIDVNGERIGVVGATTPTIVNISSPGGITVNPQPFNGVPTPEQLDALAAQIQADVDALLAANPDVNKVVLLAHMQQIAIEQALAERLTNVDIIVAGGSNTRLFDETDRARAGDTNQGPYPIIKTDAAGNPVAVVNTDGNYKYVGRLVIDFDENGIIIPESYDPNVSGAYATDAQGVADLGAEGLVDPEIQAIVDALQAEINLTESNVFGVSSVFLDGARSSVRIQETNLGNLTADANLVYAREVLSDDSIVVSIKNGGGIRNSIGRQIVPPGGTGAPEELPNEEIPGVKPAGGISQNDIANSLSFNNDLVVLDITREGLLAVLEHGVAASSLDDANTQGRFPQVSGIEFSFDLTRPAGDRVISAAIKDEAGNILDVLAENGALVGDPAANVRIVTLGFLAEGGDGYPFPNFSSNPQALLNETAFTGEANFAADGTEQDALAEYLFDNFLTTPFNEVDTERNQDTRIQNLAFREDTVFGEVVDGYFNFIQYAQFQSLDEGIGLSVPTAEVNGIQLALLFDETYYLAENQDVAGAVQNGTFGSGFEHFLAFGLVEGRDPSVLFDEDDYLETYQDVADAVASGSLSSGLSHYLNFGVLEQRDPSSVFSEEDYLLTNADVAAAVEQGAFTNGFDHYLEAGAAEGRGPNLLLFQETFYLTNNTDVAEAIGAGAFASGLEHYIRFGQGEERNPSSLFDESAYLTAYTDVAEAVAGNLLSSGFEHYIKFGRAEGREAIAVA